MNVIWIVSDTLRADYLGCYGSTWVKTPNLDALAARSTVFEEHHAASFPTIPARADFLTGKWTFTYRGWEPMASDERVLPEILSEAGYRTVGVADTPFYTPLGFRFDRGFHVFTQLDAQYIEGEWAWGEYAARGKPLPNPRLTEFDYAAPQTMTLAEKYLEGLHEQPFFLLVDTWDPHEPWDPPAWYVKQYQPDYDGRQVFPPNGFPPYGNWREAGVSEAEMTTARASYAGMITMVDRWIGRLLDRVQTLGIADDTAIVFTSDHGFYVGERDQIGKMARREDTDAWMRSVLYREVTHVPLIIHVPGSPPARVSELTSAVDIMPTVVDLLTDTGAGATHGQSLMPLVRGEADAKGREFVVTAVSLQYDPGVDAALVDGRAREVLEPQPVTITTAAWTLIYARPGIEVELYDMTIDPGQRDNVAPDHPDIVARLVDQYIALLEAADTPQRYVDVRRPATGEATPAA